MIPTWLARRGFSARTLVQNHDAAIKTDISPEVLRFAQDDRAQEAVSDGGRQGKNMGKN
jgi:hypothetical protein